jgi:hypothetical protein
LRVAVEPVELSDRLARTVHLHDLPWAEIQITTREYLTIKKADLGSSCGLRGPLALLAL